jgi:hypothetical protein
MTPATINSSIAKAKWNGAKWDGDKITFRIKAINPGTTTITVYRKNFRFEYFKTIDVTVV